MSAGDPVGRVEQLEREVASLQRRLDRSMGEIERLEQEIARMQKLLEEEVRKKKRNTAPFSRDNPKPNPKTAGRKAGDRYGQQATRPTPLRVDEQIAALPVDLFCVHRTAYHRCLVPGRVTHRRCRVFVHKPKAQKAISSPPKAGCWVRFRKQGRVISRECRSAHARL